MACEKERERQQCVIQKSSKVAITEQTVGRLHSWNFQIHGPKTLTTTKLQVKMTESLLSMIIKTNYMLNKNILNGCKLSLTMQCNGERMRNNNYSPLFLY